ncbi:hypothetical protein BSKO_00096 [Bryopsis sp. KO-2023]|nr:hypothetical protein BSKO_00096 [Bryopsis sp. KO-2023]
MVALEALEQAAAPFIESIPRTGDDEMQALCRAAHELTELASIGPKIMDGIWRIACMLWNSCVKFANGWQKDESTDSIQRCARLRQIASGLCDLLEDDCLDDEQKTSKVVMHYQTGCCWVTVHELENAEVSFSKAMEYCPFLEGLCMDARTPRITKEEHSQLIFDILISRAGTAWKLQQNELAGQLYSSAKDLGTAEHISNLFGCELGCQLVSALVDQSADLLSLAENAAKALCLLDGAYELIGDVTSRLSVQNLQGEDAEHGSAISAMITKLEGKVLRGLCLAHLLLDDGESAAKCLESLKKADQSHKTHPAVSALTFKVLLNLRQFKEAQTELLNVVTSEDVCHGVCLEALAEFVKEAQELDAVRSALSLIEERFPNEVDVPIQFAAAVLTRKQGVSEEEENCVVELLTKASTVAMILEAMDDDGSNPRQTAFSLLWNHGVMHFDERRYERASKLFQAAMVFQENSDKSKNSRVAALCHIGLQDFDRAIEFVEDAEMSVEGGPLVCNCFIRYKIALVQKNVEEAVKQLDSMTVCEDFQSDMMQVACQEAISNGAHQVAKQALLKLHTSIVDCQNHFEPGIENSGEKSTCKVSEAVVLRSLIKCSMEAASENNEAPSAANSVHSELAKWFHFSAERLECIGYEAFFKEKIGEKPLDLEWLASTSWNSALNAGEVQEYEHSAVLFSSCAAFLGGHPSPTIKLLTNRKVAYLLAAASALEVHNANPEHSMSLDLAKRMVSCCRSVVQEVCAKMKATGATETPSGDRSDVFLVMQDFQVATRTKNEDSQREILERCKGMPAVNAQHVLKMGKICKDGVYRKPEVLVLALEIALRKLMEEIPTNYDQVAVVIRSLIQQSSSDTEKLGWYQEANQILLGIHQGCFPEIEISWLVSSCWNQGCHHAKFSRVDNAEKYMSTAIELLKHAHSLEQKRDMMVEEFQRVRAK